MEVIRFQANVTVEVALKYADGKAVEGRYGDQVLFTLTDDRIMYLDPPVADRIKTLRIAKGELFQICKREVKRNSKRTISWEVKRVDPMPETAAVSAATVSDHQASAPSSSQQPNGSTDDNRLEHQLRASIAMVEGQKNGSSGSAVLDAIAMTSMGKALKIATGAAYLATEFAKQIGYSVHFEGEQIYKLACTIAINQAEANGGRR